MTDKFFLVTNINELRALQRVFREAKFCPEAGDDEITESPIVATLFSQLMDALIAAETAIDGPQAKKRWENWLVMDNPLRDEWKAVRQRLKLSERWPRMNMDEKRAYILTLFKPFHVPESKLDLLMAEVDNSSA